jgi:YHS domain-containing protein
MNRTLTWIALAAAALVTAPAAAHDVKDPVCRMMVDSDTTRFNHKLGSKTFYFCSKQCQTRFAQAPGKYEKLAAQLETQDARDYTVELETTPREPVAGRPVTMAFAIRYADSKELVREFERVHEKLLHALMVTEELSWFEHQHPVRGKDGIFRLTWTFPRPGRYRLYADFTPSDGDNQVKPLDLTVGGGPAKPLPLQPDRKLTKQIGDYRVDLRLRPASLRMEQAAILTYTIRDRRGRPIRDMQPFIGAPGHLIAISRDGKEVVHTHSLRPTASPAMAKETGSAPETGHVKVTPEMATEKGPAFSFKLTLPTGGLYKTWAQFMHGNRVITVPFAFQVADLWEIGSGR